MIFSSAPNYYPSGTRPVAASGAGVLFAAGPLGRRMDEWEVAGLSAGIVELNQSRRASCGSVAFFGRERWTRVGLIRPPHRVRIPALQPISAGSGWSRGIGAKAWAC